MIDYKSSLCEAMSLILTWSPACVAPIKKREKLFLMDWGWVSVKKLRPNGYVCRTPLEGIQEENK